MVCDSNKHFLSSISKYLTVYNQIKVVPGQINMKILLCLWWAKIPAHNYCNRTYVVAEVIPNRFSGMKAEVEQGVATGKQTADHWNQHISSPSVFPFLFPI